MNFQQGDKVLVEMTIAGERDGRPYCVVNAYSEISQGLHPISIIEDLAEARVWIREVLDSGRLADSDFADHGFAILAKGDTE